MKLFNNNKKTQTQKIDEIDTVIGPGTKFEGDLKATGIVRIDGMFNGDIYTTGDIIIGDHGETNGTMTSRNMIIAGKTNSKLKCEEKLEIRSTGKVIGDVEVKNIIIEENAVFKGQCIMKFSDVEPTRENPNEISNKQILGKDKKVEGISKV